MINKVFCVPPIALIVYMSPLESREATDLENKNNSRETPHGKIKAARGETAHSQTTTVAAALVLVATKGKGENAVP